MEISYLLITEQFLFWSFREWEIRSSLRQNVDGKVIFNIYWLLRSSCFELFGDGKYGLFSARKLMERWYLLGLFELSMIFQDLRNMVFCAVLACDTATAKNMGWLWWLLQWWWSYWVVRGLSKARLGSTDRETVNAYYLASITLVGWYFVEDERKETKKLLE